MLVEPGYELASEAGEEKKPGAEEDLQAVVEGVMTARRIMSRLGTDVLREVVPGGERVGLRFRARDSASRPYSLRENSGR